jgi:S1-C subfamily serine protease
MGFLRRSEFRLRVTGLRTARRICLALAIAHIPAAPSHAQDIYEFWQQEQQRNGALKRRPAVSVKEYLAPFVDRLYACWSQEVRQALANEVTPTDFSRIIAGACGPETQALASAIIEKWSADLPSLAHKGGSVAVEAISKARKRVISTYTERWYASLKERETPKPSASEPAKAWSGTGFFVTGAGHLLTNAHVARDCGNPVIRMPDGSTTGALVIALGDKADLALMKAHVTTEHFARIRVTPEPREGDQVTVFGFPLAGMLSSTGNATFGYVSAIKGLGDNDDHLQISAAVQSGNSGGPLLDASGNVIGVVFAKLGLKAAALTGDLPQNINFAVKATVATRFLTSQAVAFTTAESRDEISKADAVDRAKKFSVQILRTEGFVCAAGTASRAFP